MTPSFYYNHKFQYVGFAASLAVFILQFVSLYIHADSEKEDQYRPFFKRMIAYLVHALVLNIAFFASVCLFRGYWHLLDVYFIFPG